MLAVLLLATPMAAKAQGLMSGTGMQPSTQLATPPSAPAIDQPGAEQRALARRAHGTASSARTSTTTRANTRAASTPASPH